MFDTTSLAHLPKPAQYEALATQAHALMSGEHNLIANAANLSALVMSSLPDLNWAGFYLYDGTELVLGPFQGKPACLRIALNRGVCGKAATTVGRDMFTWPAMMSFSAGPEPLYGTWVA